MSRLFVSIFETFCILTNISYTLFAYTWKNMFLINSHICIHLSITFWGKHAAFVLKLPSTLQQQKMSGVGGIEWLR